MEERMSSTQRVSSQGLARRLPGVAAMLALALLVQPAASAPKPRPISAPAPVRTGLENLERQVKDFTLPNGLKFIVVERHVAPVFSFETMVDAGSADDAIGTTGLAHMMEHMAFKGTPIVGTNDYKDEQTALDQEEAAWSALLNEQRRGIHADSTRLKTLTEAFANAQAASRRFVVSNQFSSVLEQAGAQNMNASTATDYTNYFYSLPSNQLELWALMEGSRLGHPVFREFYKERDVVYEERRMRSESSPFGRLLQEYVHAAYTAHPYGFGGIGFPSDLKTFSRTQGDQFFKSHYVAKAMTVAVVGDVAVPEVQTVAQKYFSDISDAAPAPPVDTVEPEQQAERRVILEEASQPIILMGWHIPAASDPHYAAYRALVDLLGGGDWARLNKTLVKEQKIATQIEAFSGYPGEKYPSMFNLIVVPSTGQDPEKVEQAIYAVMHEVMTNKPITAAELAGYKVRVKAQKIGTAENNATLAGALVQAQTLYGDWHQFFREQERVQSLTTADLSAAMEQSFRRNNRTVTMIVNPSPQAANEGGK
jgi:predicted Zn-dependent peptidase